MEANRLWPELSDRAGGGTGLQRCGVLYIARTEDEMAKFDRFLGLARDHQLDTRLVGREELSRMMPGAKADWVGGLYTPSDMKAEPWAAVPALARAAAKDGLTIRENCAVRAIDVEAGRVVGVETEAGRIRAPEVVVAAGAWSRMLLNGIGVSIPQLAVRSSVLATQPMPEVGFAGGAADGGIAWRRRSDGGYTLTSEGPTEHFVGPDSFRSLRLWMAQIRRDPKNIRLMPAAPGGFPDAWTTRRRWTGESPFERDAHPRPRAQRQADRACAEGVRRNLSGHAAAEGQGGLGRDDRRHARHRTDRRPGRGAAGPDDRDGDERAWLRHRSRDGAHRRRSRAGRPAGHDLSRFRLSRFTDGSLLELGPSL